MFRAGAEWVHEAYRLGLVNVGLAADASAERRDHDVAHQFMGGCGEESGLGDGVDELVLAHAVVNVDVAGPLLRHRGLPRELVVVHFPKGAVPVGDEHPVGAGDEEIRIIRPAIEAAQAELTLRRERLTTLEELNARGFAVSASSSSVAACA